MRVLLLGGTTEASQMAIALADAGINAIYSYAGRTNSPVSQPLPTRIGGFGGVPGLIDYLRAQNITHIIDATHPFAAGMSRNAFVACRDTKVALLRLERAPWVAQDGDNWSLVPTLENIPALLPDAPARVFLAIGKQHIGLFAAKPQHHYLLRLVDAPDAPLPIPNVTVLLARGPFTTQGDTALMQEHAITHVVAKNAGGTGARAKLDAARALDLPVIMANRPSVPGDATANDVAQVMAWLHHVADRGV